MVGGKEVETVDGDTCTIPNSKPFASPFFVLNMSLRIVTGSVD